jgi:hypothetical protein
MYSPRRYLPRMLRRFTASTSYWQTSRAPRYSLLFALPLLVAYELLAAFLSAHARLQVRNGADVLLKTMFVTLAGERGPLVFGVCLIGGALWFVGRDVRARGAPNRPGVFAGMALESVVLALATGTIVGLATAQLVGRFGALPAPGSAAQPASIGSALHEVHAALAVGPKIPGGKLTALMLSLGAGLYEELLFRVLLVSTLAALARRLFGLGPGGSGVVAAIGGALVFSAFHYIGAYGDPWELTSFVYRALAGLFFSALYLTRGFGITAWTHALYDILVLVF